jgi:hypothetical protein
LANDVIVADGALMRLDLCPLLKLEDRLLPWVCLKHDDVPDRGFIQ